ERYNGKMTGDEREKAQASFMQSGRKVVMLATNAFGLGIDKPDIRYIIHYQMPGSPESYVQEAGRAGRDGKPARCVLLFQPEDIEIQEHFLKEAHPTKTQARMVAEGLYAWSDEGKEVSVRDLAMSMALPERRVRVVLSVLEAMGVAEEVKAARWKGVDPKPTREAIDKAASVFEARRISDRRRLASLLAYMNTQKCRVQMLRAYFGEPEGDKCGLCDSDAGLDSEMFDPGTDDGRHGLHAATDFHARPRRRRRRGGEEQPQQQLSRGAQMRQPRLDAPGVATAAAAPARVFATAIPTDILPPLPAAPPPVADASENTFDPSIWTVASAGEGLDDGEQGTEGKQGEHGEHERVGQPMAGEPVMEDYAVWLSEIDAATRAAARDGAVNHAAATSSGLAGVPMGSTGDEAEKPLPEHVLAVESALPEAVAGAGGGASASMRTEDGSVTGETAGDPFVTAWESVRDANIRPYIEWRAAEVISLPVITRPVSAPGQGGRPTHVGNGGGGGNGHVGRPDQARGGGGGGGGGGNDRQGRRRRGGGGGGGGGGGPKFRDRGDRGGGSDRGGDRGNRGDRNRDRDRGPRLPGFYNPGGD
ncbi:MAG: helicase-related protein, partial [Polyangia bacterium]